MKRSLKVFVVLVGLMIFGVVAASAQEEVPPRLPGVLLEIVIEETGMRPREILRDIRSGSTLAEVIESSGGSVDSVIDTAVTAITEAVNARVADGTLTQAEGEHILGNLEARVTNAVNGEGIVRRLFERRLRAVVLDLAAEQTGLTREEIVTQMRGGSSLADVLSANGADVNTFIDIVVAEVGERFSQRGRIPQEQLDERLAQLRERLTERIHATNADI